MKEVFMVSSSVFLTLAIIFWLSGRNLKRLIKNCPMNDPKMDTGYAVVIEDTSGRTVRIGSFFYSYAIAESAMESTLLIMARKYTAMRRTYMEIDGDRNTNPEKAKLYYTSEVIGKMLRTLRIVPIYDSLSYSGFFDARWTSSIDYERDILDKLSRILADGNTPTGIDLQTVFRTVLVTAKDTRMIDDWINGVPEAMYNHWYIPLWLKFGRSKRP